MVLGALILVGCGQVSHSINELLRDDGERAPNAAEVTLLPTPTPTPSPTPPCKHGQDKDGDCKGDHDAQDR